MINIVTRCSNPKNILKIKESIFNQAGNIVWWVFFDTSVLKNIDSYILENLDSTNIKTFFKKSKPGDFAHEFINMAIEKIKTGWVYVLDDDNILHEDFVESITDIINKHPNKKAIVFNQKIDKRDFTGLDIRIAKPENMMVQHIDMAQFILKRDIIGDNRFKLFDYKSDGHFIEKIYNNSPEDFYFLDKILCYYNFFKSEKMPVTLPRILLLGENCVLKTNKLSEYEEDRLNVRYIEDCDVDKVLSEFNPDSILTIGKSFQEFPNLCNKNIDVRLRWIHSDNFRDDLGEQAYLAAMNYILTGQDQNPPMISFFTPIYNTGDKLITTYNSIKDQTYTNWEWVVVNDSTDGGKTLKIVEKLAESDSRIKLYDFNNKTGGIIGEAKFRAASLCSGKWIMELDHDDILIDRAGELMVKAFEKYPDCKFVYSDFAEIDQNWQSLCYGGAYSFGYGKYRTERYRDRDYLVASCDSINPITIRHIVGVPNHFRAWEREFYHSIGGHNRRLTIADDYELIIRSFLKTKFVNIKKLLYLQLFHNSDTLNNTQTSSRFDIQRRVRTIASYYNLKIKERFDELGIEDWAFLENPNNPLLTNPRFGDLDSKVNYIWMPDEE